MQLSEVVVRLHLQAHESVSKARNEDVKRRCAPSAAGSLLLALPELAMANKGNKQASRNVKKRCVQARDQRDDASRPTNKQGLYRVTGRVFDPNQRGRGECEQHDELNNEQEEQEEEGWRSAR